MIVFEVLKETNLCSGTLIEYGVLRRVSKMFVFPVLHGGYPFQGGFCRKMSFAKRNKKDLR